MTNTKPLRTFLILLFVAIVGFVSLRSCVQDVLEVVKPGQTDLPRQKQQAQEVVARSVYAADTARMKAENRALQRELQAVTSKLPRQEEKAQHSAATYRENRTPENCKDALQDCEEASETKSYALNVQNRMLQHADSTQKRDRKEIARSWATADSAFAGWKEANTALQKAQKPKRFGIGLQAGYGVGNAGLTPFVGIGLSYNILSW